MGQRATGGQGVGVAAGWGVGGASGRQRVGVAAGWGVGGATGGQGVGGATGGQGRGGVSTKCCVWCVHLPNALNSSMTLTRGVCRPSQAILPKGGHHPQEALQNI